MAVFTKVMTIYYSESSERNAHPVSPLSPPLPTLYTQTVLLPNSQSKSPEEMLHICACIGQKPYRGRKHKYEAVCLHTGYAKHSRLPHDVNYGDHYQTVGITTVHLVPRLVGKRRYTRVILTKHPK